MVLMETSVEFFSRQLENGARWIGQKCQHIRFAGSQKYFYFVRWPIPDPQPNELGWRPKRQGQIKEILIFGNYGKAGRSGIVPHRPVIRVGQTDRNNLFAIREINSQPFGQSPR
jgi:hypothetical protein